MSGTKSPPAGNVCKNSASSSQNPPSRLRTCRTTLCSHPGEEQEWSLTGESQFCDTSDIGGGPKTKFIVRTISLPGQAGSQLPSQNIRKRTKKGPKNGPNH